MKLNPVLCPPSHNTVTGSGHYVVCSRYLAGKLVTGILAEVQLAYPAAAVAEATDLPVLTYRCSPALETLLATVVATPPDDRQVDSALGAEYQFWLVRDPELASSLQSALDGVDAFYWLDGWTESAQQPALAPPAGVPQGASDQAPVALLLADDQLEPRARHRLLADLDGMDAQDFLQKLHKCFNIRAATDAAQAMPSQAREMGLYLDGYWYCLSLIAGTWFAQDPVSDMDVSILADNVFALMLGITHADQSGRIGIADPVLSPQQLAELVDQGEWQAAFVLYPPTVEYLMALSDAGRVPPARTVAFGQSLPWIAH